MSLDDYGVRREYDNPVEPSELILVDERDGLSENTAYIRADTEYMVEIDEMR